MQLKTKQIKEVKREPHLKKLKETAIQKDLYLKSWMKENKKFLSYFQEEKKDKIVPFHLNLPNRLYGVPVGVKDIFSVFK